MLVKNQYLFTTRDVWVLCTVVYIEGRDKDGVGSAPPISISRSIDNTFQNTHTSLCVNKYLRFTNIEFPKTSSR